MDLGALGTLTIDWAFLSGFFNIIIINLILSGDNAVVIAMAVQSLQGISAARASCWGPESRFCSG